MPVLISSHEIKLEFSDLDTWVQRPYPESARVRSSGTHLSGVLRYVLQQTGKLKKDEKDPDDMPTVMALGMGFENWVVGLKENHGIIWQPGEWECDGVYGTPDGLSRVNRDLWQLEEFKFTLKSEWTKGKEHILSQYIWIWQLAANCYALSEQMGVELTQARLHVLWACGDYRPPSPKYMQYVIRFKWEELVEFWVNVVLRNKDAEGVRKEVH